MHSEQLRQSKERVSELEAEVDRFRAAQLGPDDANSVPRPSGKVSTQEAMGMDTNAANNVMFNACSVSKRCHHAYSDIYSVFLQRTVRFCAASVGINPVDNWGDIPDAQVVQLCAKVCRSVFRDTFGLDRAVGPQRDADSRAVPERLGDQGAVPSVAQGAACNR